MSAPPRGRPRSTRQIAILVLSANSNLTAQWCRAVSLAPSFGRIDAVSDVASGLRRLRQTPSADVVLLDRLLPDLEPDVLARISEAAPATAVVVHAGRVGSTSSGFSDASTLVREVGEGVGAKPDTVLFPGTPTPELARGFVADACQRWGMAGMIESAELIVTELITNAVRHGLPPTTLHVGRTSSGVRIDVRDGSPKLPVLSLGDPLGESGRGLAVIDAFAAAWGTQRVLGGKSVWALLAGGESPAASVYPSGTSVEFLGSSGDWEPGFFVVHGDDLGYVLGRVGPPGDTTAVVAAGRVRVSRRLPAERR